MVQFEYTINQGVAPTLLYPVPSPNDSPILSAVIKSLRDYYPLWQVCVNALRSITILFIFFAARLPNIRIYIPILDLYRFTGTTQEVPTPSSYSTVIHPSDLNPGIFYRPLWIHRFCSSHSLLSDQYGRVVWWLSVVSDAIGISVYQRR